jgi:hypothetical protein
LSTNKTLLPYECRISSIRNINLNKFAKDGNRIYLVITAFGIFIEYIYRIVVGIVVTCAINVK